MKTTFIGGGNMATALINGLNQISPASESVRVSDPSAEVRDRLHREFGVQCFDRAAEAIAGADAILLAVKPQIMPAVLEELAAAIQPGQLVISVAAGTSLATISGALGEGIPVIRTMPNTPALLGCGMTGLYAGPDCTAAQLELAETIMAAVGATVFVEQEDQMNVVTAVSGSGPAYFYLMTEALREAGVGEGLPFEVAARLAVHTAHGAGVMAALGDVDVAELRKRVTSPGGTTQAALDELAEKGFKQIIARAVHAATERGRELAGPGDPA